MADDYMAFLAANHAARKGAGRPVKRRRRSRVGKDGKPTESAIQGAVVAALRAHPGVAMVWRQNAGVVQAQSGYVMRVGEKGMADVGGILRGGRALQIEIKRPGIDVAAGTAQAEWLHACSDAGAAAGVAHGVEEALAIVDEATGADNLPAPPPRSHP